MPYDTGVPFAARRSATLALLVWVAAEYSGTARAADDFSDAQYPVQILISVNAKNCFDIKLSPQKRIAGCTWVIDRGNVGNTNTAKLHVARGTVLDALGKRDEAIADFT